jgi:hypothetical protein
MIFAGFSLEKSTVERVLLIDTVIKIAPTFKLVTGEVLLFFNKKSDC